MSRLAELHGGSVAVDSAGVPGLGSCFSVTLPWRSVEPPAAAPAPAIRAAAPVRPGVRVLVAEDNEYNLHAIGPYLEHLGYTVVLARHGQQAVDLAVAQRPALILMDVQMPVLDGLEATRRLRAVPALAATPIIALTALTMPGDQERCLQAGASDYLSKPVSLKDLGERVAHWLSVAPALGVE